MRILVTGGAGFIGSRLIKKILFETNHEVLNIDKLTYASNRIIIEEFKRFSRYKFSKTDICNSIEVDKIISNFAPNWIVHLAAESHVDRSISGPKAFLESNIVGTFNLLESSRAYYSGLSALEQEKFRFLGVSTDEVYGDLDPNEDAFSEDSQIKPSSPYSASKAAADHLILAWGRTYKLPVILSNCSNNYGPNQYREKLIPLIVHNALRGLSLPIYGDGQQVRDWLHVDDHAAALLLLCDRGQIGERYNVGACQEHTNIFLVHMICDILDELLEPEKIGIKTFRELIQFIEDRPGHDKRYAINPKKIMKNLNWAPEINFTDGLYDTVKSYIDAQTRLTDFFNSEQEMKR